MKILFVINPISGGVDKQPFLEKAKTLCEKYGIEYVFFKTKGKEDEARLKEALDDFNPNKVASVGGDGTTLLTAKTLLNKNFPFGIIPVGSANGMASELFVSQDPIKALEDLIMSQVILNLDMLVINDKHHMLHIGDVGINANIVDAYAKDQNKGMATYAKYFIEKFREINPFTFKIQAERKVYKESGVMVGICNSRKYGTGIPLNLNGDPTDGKFEIVIVKDINLGSLIKASLSKFDEYFYDNQDRKVITTTKAEILFDTPRLLQLDGEVIGEFEKLKINILKSAVKVISHKGKVKKKTD